MFKAKQNIQLHNKFDLQLIDSRTGKVKQTARAENTVLNNFWNYFGNNSANYYHGFLYGVAMGTGSGTPSSMDTGMFTQAFMFTAYAQASPSPSDAALLVQRTIANPTSTLIGRYTIPATSAYVGNLTEIGAVKYANGQRVIITHAMLEDAEGNPITIQKTDLDILVVTVTLYLTITSTEAFTIFWNSNNGFINNFKMATSSGSGTQSGIMTVNTLYPLTCATDTYAGGRVTFNGQTNTTNTWNASTHTLTLVGTRVPTEAGNTNYINGLEVAGHGYFRLPNADIFPPYTVQGMSVGTGDGTTTDFDCPLPVFIKDTDIIYKNNVPLVRGVDYTIDNQQNKDGLVCISAGNFAEVISDVTLEEVGSYGSAYYNFYPLFKASYNGGGYQRRLGYKLIDRSHAEFLFDLEEGVDSLVGNKVNRVMLTYLVGTNYNYLTTWTGYVVLDYTIDGNEWIELYRKSLSEANNVSQLTLSFDTIEPKKVRFRVIDAHDSVQSQYYPPWIEFGATGASTTNNTYSKLWYEGDPIKFTVPPADGDVITMDAQIDRPFKNENFVLDASATIQF